MVSPTRAAGAMAAALFLASPVRAQDSAAAAAGAALRPSRHAWLAPLASLLVPGSGQLLLGQDRGIVYLAVEAFAVGAYAHQTGIAGSEGDRFRDLAFDVARRAFQPGVRDTTFEYFETMTRFVESGLFDLDAGPALVPETDPRTYNGSVWLLARLTYWEDPDVPPDPASPEYFRAIRFYQERAVGPNFQWSWRNASLEHEAFSQAIRLSDGAYRRAANYLGLLLANHVLSATDALVSSRLTRIVGRSTRVVMSLRAGGGARLAVVIER